MKHYPKVVAIGGGTGLATLLRGLKYYPVSLSGIVTMTDNGASSGRLSREMGTLPPGDVRKCLAALSSDETLMTKLFEYRFDRGRGLSGHSLGNLLLLALSDLTGDFESAIEACGKILSIKGEVIPSTYDHVSLVAELKNGLQALGEVEIPILGHRFGIKSLSLLPPDAGANPTALRFIESADLILIGPGSLYTSILPNFLIKDLRRSFKKSTAVKYYIANVSTERGETEKFSIEDHVAALREHIGSSRLDGVIVNTKILSSSKSEGNLGSVRNITSEGKTVAGVPVMATDIVDEKNPLHHDHKKLAAAIWQAFISQDT
ncbi:hypothetical protein A3A71_03820 [Candidatus Berkelbacteria bacterium RIFCSPLOWO2_01_FULL_50_28]|uniref:Putative gluconeogenesis factor n=1 Tax=Candidatus Berkelbacteria bacterium RIFCSPLOWO2_01_FULL_50_28 TaxID=1797471 RepID=A0A1F5EA74_9BACT|nr:MAG: hypothetical protein A3F39_01185 [Candidatus Berkelbacteria bacterium RIFCSPHIGHO2_12_FULL_50_11]OGD64275.1 MAG: hypothetical protein A3A71_03820 [Candidatus Berkelbacteria bacterium RIFCSPLOWO2_01_FULL_50_28]